MQSSIDADNLPRGLARLLRQQEVGGLGISPPTLRPWGDTVAYGADPDGHIVAFASRAAACPLTAGDLCR